MSASLSELIGKKGANEPKLSLEGLRDLLGEKMPELPRNQVGRMRLISSLRQRFGDGFRSIPGISGIIQEFDADVKDAEREAQMRTIKPKRKR